MLSTKEGNNSQMAIHGLIWAPNTPVELGNVTNTVVAQIIGGAVVSAMHVQASGSADGLLISVQGAPSSDKWALTSTATKDGGTTRVRVIAEVRHSSTDAWGADRVGAGSATTGASAIRPPAGPRRIAVHYRF